MRHNHNYFVLPSLQIQKCIHDPMTEHGLRRAIVLPCQPTRLGSITSYNTTSPSTFANSSSSSNSALPESFFCFTPCRPSQYTRFKFSNRLWRLPGLGNCQDDHYTSSKSAGKASVVCIRMIRLQTRSTVSLINRATIIALTGQHAI